MMPTSNVFGRETYLSSDLPFKASPNNEQSTINYVVDLMDCLYDIYYTY